MHEWVLDWICNFLLVCPLLSVCACVCARVLVIVPWLYPCRYTHKRVSDQLKKTKKGKKLHFSCVKTLRSAREQHVPLLFKKKKNHVNKKKKCFFFDGEHDVFYSVLWCTATTFYYMNFCKCRRIKIHSNMFCLSGDFIWWSLRQKKIFYQMNYKMLNGLVYIQHISALLELYTACFIRPFREGLLFLHLRVDQTFTLGCLRSNLG